MYREEVRDADLDASCLVMNIQLEEAYGAIGSWGNLAYRDCMDVRLPRLACRSLEVGEVGLGDVLDGGHVSVCLYRWCSDF